MKTRCLFDSLLRFRNAWQSKYNLQNIFESIPFNPIVIEGFLSYIFVFEFLQNGNKYQIQI